MNINRYIGLCILKYQSCYVDGIGSLTLKRVPASFDGAIIINAAHEVVLNAAAAPDNRLAQLIANNESIPIDQAKNEIQYFSQETLADMESGKGMQIPALGRLINEGYGFEFETNPVLLQAYPALPASRTPRTAQPIGGVAVQLQPKSTPVHYTTPERLPHQKKTKFNPGKAIFMVFLALIILASAYFGYNYLHKSMASYKKNKIKDSTTTKTTTSTTPAAEPAALPADTATIVTGNLDSMHILSLPGMPLTVLKPGTVAPTIIYPTQTAPVNYAPADNSGNIAANTTTTAAAAATSPNIQLGTPDRSPANYTEEPVKREVNTGRTYHYDVILNKFYTPEQAQIRLTQLQNSGNRVRLLTRDSINYYIILPVTSSSSRTDHILDSLSKKFNSTEVSIY
ncbi:MAG: hypothetical protein H0X33_06160 [Taibaiella sp.]|nr:hypothetical protein [Taibaiella sp.]